MLYCARENICYQYDNDAIYYFNISEFQIDEFAAPLPINDTIMRFAKFSICRAMDDIYLIYKSQTYVHKYADIRITSDGVIVTRDGAIYDDFLNKCEGDIDEIGAIWDGAYEIAHVYIINKNGELIYAITTDDVFNNSIWGLRRINNYHIPTHNILLEYMAWMHVLPQLRMSINRDTISILFRGYYSKINMNNIK